MNVSSHLAEFQNAVTFWGDVCGISPTFENRFLEFLSKIGAGDEARTRNFQLQKLNFQSFIFNTYRIASEDMYVHALPDLRSLWDVCGTVCHLVDS